MTEVAKRVDMCKMIEICKQQEQVDCPITHEFADGLYIRTMSVPAGTFVIGHVHRNSTYNILLQGSATVRVGDEGETKFIKAPATFISEPGVRKAALFHEDSKWVNCFPTEETDIDRIEKMVAYDEAELLENKKGGTICP